MASLGEETGVDCGSTRGERNLPSWLRQNFDRRFYGKLLIPSEMKEEERMT
jgi:hypothetical protein